MIRTRLLLAFALAPAIPAAIVVLPGFFFGASVSDVASFFCVVSVVTYGHTILLGAPLALLLIRLRRLNLRHVLVAAFLAGAVPIGAFVLYQEITMPPGSGYESNSVILRADGRLTPAGLISAITGVLQCGLLGLVAGLGWWWLLGAAANNALKSDANVAAKSGSLGAP